MFRSALFSRPLRVDEDISKTEEPADEELRASRLACSHKLLSTWSNIHAKYSGCNTIAEEEDDIIDFSLGEVGELVQDLGVIRMMSKDRKIGGSDSESGHGDEDENVDDVQGDIDELDTWGQREAKENPAYKLEMEREKEDLEDLKEFFSAERVASRRAGKPSVASPTSLPKEIFFQRGNTAVPVDDPSQMSGDECSICPSLPSTPAVSRIGRSISRNSSIKFSPWSKTPKLDAESLLIKSLAIESPLNSRIGQKRKWSEVSSLKKSPPSKASRFNHVLPTPPQSKTPSLRSRSQSALPYPRTIHSEQKPAPAPIRHVPIIPFRSESKPKINYRYVDLPKPIIRLPQFVLSVPTPDSSSSQQKRDNAEREEYDLADPNKEEGKPVGKTKVVQPTHEFISKEEEEAEDEDEERHERNGIFDGTTVPEEQADDQYEEFSATVSEGTFHEQDEHSDVSNDDEEVSDGTSVESLASGSGAKTTPRKPEKAACPPSPPLSKFTGKDLENALGIEWTPPLPSVVDKSPRNVLQEYDIDELDIIPTTPSPRRLKMTVRTMSSVRKSREKEKRLRFMEDSEESDDPLSLSVKFKTKADTTE